jgi:hydrogenase expression/formation protein HypC
MCLAIPAKITEIDSSEKCAVVEVLGVRRKADLSLLESVQVGDYILLHAGFAISRVNEEEALETLEIHRELAQIRMENDSP